MSAISTKTGLPACSITDILDRLELLLTDSSIEDLTTCLHFFRGIEHQIHELFER